MTSDWLTANHGLINSKVLLRPPSDSCLAPILQAAAQNAIAIIPIYWTTSRKDIGRTGSRIMNCPVQDCSLVGVDG